MKTKPHDAIKSLTNDHIKDKFWISEFSDFKVLILSLRFSCPLFVPVSSRFRSVILNLGLKPLFSSLPKTLQRVPVCICVFVFDTLLVRFLWAPKRQAKVSLCEDVLCVCFICMCVRFCAPPPSYFTATHRKWHLHGKEGTVSHSFSVLCLFDKHMSTNA